MKYLIHVILICFVMTNSSAQQERESNNAEAAINLYLEAISVIRENAIKTAPGINREDIIRDTMKAYLRSIDSYSDYLNPDEYLAFKESQQSHYVGVGMEIEKNAAGQFVCTPISGGPAESAGIQEGDILEFVDGVNISEKSIFMAASKIKGKEGTKVEFIIQSKFGVQKKLSIKRTAMQFKTASKKMYSQMPVIKIQSFKPATVSELRELIEYQNLYMDKNQPIVIDLRGNSGGDFHSAVDCAMLFLEKGKPIVNIMTKNGVKRYECTLSPFNSTSCLFLWQNQQTASAAEVFIAALTENQRAKSIGKTTFGKGIKQDIIELSDGSAMILTTGYMIPPNGVIFHEKGLAPSFMLKDSPKDSDYIDKLKELIK